ncbi:MAG TPA: FMN-binding negative transcriptional regulator [Thermoleophilaceae bacterium]|nr:FMN-binding negative transcriptional regulator [Thermoleophilaceae bacterium]
MRHNPKHAVEDEQVVRRLIAENPWATIVSQNNGDLVASHYPVLLDEEADGLAVVTHVGRPDEKVHGLGSTEVLLIVAGSHGYVSPSWYTEHDTPAPTWNFSVAHCYGTPQILEAGENLRVLTRLVDHFERHVDSPVPLDPEVGARLARGTVGLRLPIDRFVCKVKMSQDKEEQSRRRVLEELRGSGPYAHPALAADMERALGE